MPSLPAVPPPLQSHVPALTIASVVELGGLHEHGVELHARADCGSAAALRQEDTTCERTTRPSSPVPPAPVFNDQSDYPDSRSAHLREARTSAHQYFVLAYRIRRRSSYSVSDAQTPLAGERRMSEDLASAARAMRNFTPHPFAHVAMLDLAPLSRSPPSDFRSVIGVKTFALVSTIIRALWISHLGCLLGGGLAPYIAWAREGIGTRAGFNLLCAGERERIWICFRLHVLLWMIRDVPRASTRFKSTHGATTPTTSRSERLETSISYTKAHIFSSFISRLFCEIFRLDFKHLSFLTFLDV
ncbi:hypothetical protein B0H11DRAFT_2216059 [Mycena galericulata]|nr:hypothetical protein B0H11DRAFT_2216059 [Mycena galericulata]